MSQIQVVKIDKSILNYFFEERGLQNESREFRDIKIKEFKEQLEKALQTGAATKEIEWV